jgi:hypothetical protein
MFRESKITSYKALLKFQKKRKIQKKGKFIYRKYIVNTIYLKKKDNFFYYYHLKSNLIY